MATDSATQSVTNTLSGTTADTITLNQLWPAIEVTNHDATNNVFVTMNGTATPTTAVADANDTTLVPAGSTKVIRSKPVAGGSTIVLSIVGNGGKYTIEGVQ